MTRPAPPTTSQTNDTTCARTNEVRSRGVLLAVFGLLAFGVAAAAPSSGNAITAASNGTNSPPSGVMEVPGQKLRLRVRATRRYIDPNSRLFFEYENGQQWLRFPSSGMQSMSFDPNMEVSVTIHKSVDCPSHINRFVSVRIGGTNYNFPSSGPSPSKTWVLNGGDNSWKNYTISAVNLGCHKISGTPTIYVDTLPPSITPNPNEIEDPPSGSAIAPGITAQFRITLSPDGKLLWQYQDPSGLWQDFDSSTNSRNSIRSEKSKKIANAQIRIDQPVFDEYDRVEVTVGSPTTKFASFTNTVERQTWVLNGEVKDNDTSWNKYDMKAFGVKLTRKPAFKDPTFYVKRTHK